MTAPRTRSIVLAFVVSMLLLSAVLPSISAAQFVEGAWSSLDPNDPSPSVRESYAAVYDVLHQRYLLFAGLHKEDGYGTYYLFNEVWTLSLGLAPHWTQLSLSGSMPGGRHSAQWGYDPARNRLLIFGGYGEHYPGGSYEYLNDVWQLSLDGTPEWTELQPSGTPPSGRLAGASVYDPLRQRFIGFGGVVGLPVDTWSLDLSGESAEWVAVDTDSTSPKGGYGMTSIYDPVRDRMLIFGGSTSENYYGVQNDLWELELGGHPTWRRLAPAGTLPVARRSGTAIYDALRDRMVIFGGWDGSDPLSSFLNDAWALSLTLGPHWNQLSPDGVLPPGRNGMTAAFDPLGDRLVVFGGWGGDHPLNDTQFLSWGGVPTAPSLSASSDANPGVVHVEWTVGNATGPYAGIYRRTPDTPWSSIGTAQANASGVVSYTDASVPEGGQFGYMVVVPSQLGSSFGGETWVQVPAAVAVIPNNGVSLALTRVSPNPAVGRFVIAFSLPSGAPARLELIDLGGRRVLSRDVGALGAGSHRIEIDAARDLSPGMYFLKLAQGGRSVSRRVVIE
jgi:hypothetical protein